MTRKARWLLTPLLIIGSVAAAVAADELVVYSARNEHLIKPVFEAYTGKTGTRIRFLTGEEPVLLQRLEAEGSNTPADLLLTVDAGNLWHAAREGVLATVSSPQLSENIPAHLRDPEGRWFGLSVRARTLVYSTRRIEPADLAGYADLADPKWRGRLVLRTAKKVYNQSLVAMLMAQHGEDATEDIVRGWVANLAADPFSNDTKVMEAITASKGDVGIVNTYYFGRMLAKDPSLPLALFWPGADTGGVHVNVSGAGVTRHSRRKEAAVRFLEWLSTAEAQRIFADANMEYPVNPKVAAHPTVQAWGSFSPSPINLSNAGVLQADAIRLMDRAGYR